MRYDVFQIEPCKYLSHFIIQKHKDNNNFLPAESNVKRIKPLESYLFTHYHLYQNQHCANI